MGPLQRSGLLVLLAAVAAQAGAGDQCSGAPALAGSSNYSAVFAAAPASSTVFNGGLLSRSVSHRDHAVHDGAARAWVTMPGWENGKLSFLMQPSKGANFLMYLADLGADATVPNKSPITERFLLVLEGQLEVEVNDKDIEVGANAFAYLPPASEEFLQQTVSSKGGAKVLVFERIFAKADGMPIFKTGKVDAVDPAPAGGGGGAVQRMLLPDTDDWDVDVVVVDVRPGATTDAVRAQYNNFGALLLAGEGIFRIADSWYPVKAGDAVWIAPYVPQWFAALGSEPARLVLYRDRNTDPLFIV